MILEEIGSMIRGQCEAYTRKTGFQTAAVRLEGDEFVLWMEEQSRKQAAEFMEDVLGKISFGF